MITVAMSSKGHVLIPADVRDRMGLRAGTRLKVEEIAGALRLSVVEERPSATVEEGVGLSGYRGPPIAVEEMDPIAAIDR